MKEPYQYPPGYEPPKQRVNGGGVALGAVGGPVVVTLLSSLAAQVAGGELAVLVVGAGILGAFVLLLQSHPFWRGVGVGLLGAYAVVLLLFGACFAILSQMDFG